MTEPDVGSAAQEAVRLLRALGEASASSTAEASASSTAEASASSTAAEAVTDSHVCSNSWCPVCQVADFVRDNPEVIAGVAASAGSMLLALRDLIDAATNPAPKDRP